MIRRAVYLISLFLLILCGCSDYTISSTRPDPVIIIQNGDPNAAVWVDSFVQPNTINGIDIVWVIDTSGSMSNDEERLLAGIEAMMNALPLSGWRLNMISASPDAVLNEQQFPLVPGDTLLEATTMYNVMSTGHLEEGFNAIIDYITLNPYAQTWLRNDAALLVIFVSDEDDQSNIAVWDFESWYNIERSHVFLASIVNLPVNESLCNTSSYDVGDRYLEATSYFSGVVVDICSNDWSTGVQDASIQIQPHEFWDLSHSPAPGTVRVFFDRVLMDTGWTYDATLNRVIFTSVPPPGILVEIGYILRPDNETN